MRSSILDSYRDRVDREHWTFDAAQATVATRLDQVADALVATAPATKSSSLGWLFAGSAPRTSPRGLYIHGDVGRGKTMLMDVFYAAVPIRRKRRVHFHAFMTDAHARIHRWRQDKKRHIVQGDDPIRPVAEALAADAVLLCFDEFSVTDIADAMILGRLFDGLFACGTTVVATSNVAPQDLYQDGLNRALFLPFIAMLERHMDVVRLAAAQDFRLTKLTRAGTWFVPDDANARAAMDRLFLEMSGGRGGAPATIPLLGRSIRVPRAATGIARFAFADLFEQALGAADFLALAQAYHTVMVDGIRVISPADRNIAKRFITAVDAFYDAGVKLIASATVEPQQIYTAEDGREVFEFDRTVSRLIEMRSDGYLGSAHRGAPAMPSGDTGGLVDT